jgi:hypothetical protein
MKFAKVVFTGAGVWGLLVLTPFYFMFDFIGRSYPPAITHPDFYFGFIGLGLAWQIAFLVIGRDPVRFWPMMLPAICEKVFYVISLVVLYESGRIQSGQLSVGAPDLILACLFVTAAYKTRSRAVRASLVSSETVQTA